ncbi:MAG: thiamine phosphate synthase [Arthrobacter sp.]|nr:thiamine phosphate synthase [Arthrobacter sp.]
MGNRAIATPSLASARLYVCTDSRAERGDFADFVDAAYSGGVDIIQLRDKKIEAAEELELLTVLREAAERHGKLWAVNDRADIARLSGSPVLHVGQKDLPLPAARSLLNDEVLLGLSSHAPEQVDAALAAAVRDETNYFCVGPLWATPTKPGRAGVGLDLVRYADSTGTSVPWFAIGGIDHGNVAQVVEAGARRVVVVRAVTEASDPADAARRLLAELPDA